MCATDDVGNIDPNVADGDFDGGKEEDSPVELGARGASAVVLVEVVSTCEVGFGTGCCTFVSD